MLGAIIVFLCVNDTQLTMDNVVRELATAEQLIAGGEYEEAREIVDAYRHIHHGADLRIRANDLRALIAMRAPQPKEITAWVSTHMRDRVKQRKEPRYRAWHAEALLAEGRMTEALAIVSDLAKRDLMPDAFAYVVLAKLSIGPQREAALAACRTRAQNKAICVVPTPKQ